VGAKTRRATARDVQPATAEARSKEPECSAKGKEDDQQPTEERIERLAAAAAHPLAELLECPEEAGQRLSSVSRCIDVDAGKSVFQQNASCKGLYVVVSGDFVRKAERLQLRVTLGTARPGTWWSWPPRWATGIIPIR